MSNQMTVILHAGMHKTATTALQASLASNRAALEEHGFFYPEMGVQHHNAALNLRFPHWDPRPIRDQITLARAKAASTIIFSAEVLSILSANEIRRLRQLFHGDFVRVVFAFRHWCDFLPSRWAQNCRVRDSQTFSDYLTNVRRFPGGHLDARFDQILDRFKHNSDAEIRAVSYSNSVMLGQSVVAEMLRAMGLPGALRERILESEQILNTRLDWVEVEQTRLLNGTLSNRLGLNQNDLFESLGEFGVGNLSYRLRLTEFDPAARNALATEIRDREVVRDLSYDDPWFRELEDRLESDWGDVFTNSHRGRIFDGVQSNRVRYSDVEWCDQHAVERILDHLAQQFESNTTRTHPARASPEPVQRDES